MQNRNARAIFERALPWAVLLPLMLGGCVTIGQEAAAPPVNDPASNVMRLAQNAESKGDLSTASALYQQAHSIAPRRAAPLVALGDNLHRQGDDASAVQAYRRAVEIEPRDINALRGLGFAQMQLNDIRGALDSFNGALHVDSTDARSWNGRGVALDMLDRHPEAQHAYRTGLSIKPGGEALLTNLGLSESLAATAAPSTKPANLAQQPAAAPPASATPAGARSGWAATRR